MGATRTTDLSGSTVVADPTNDLLRYVDLTSLHVAKARALKAPEWAHILIDSDKGPLLFVGETGGRRVAVLAFDLHDSDLPVQAAYPLLVRNLVGYLSPVTAQGLPESVIPGSSVGVDAIDARISRIEIEDPSGKQWTYDLAARQTRVAFAQTDRLGVYYVTQYAGAQILDQEAFAVDFFSRDESVIAPVEQPPLPLAAAATPAEPVPSGAQFKREVWPTIALVGLAVLLFEWLYTQRVALRRALTEMRARRELERLERGEV
jgi:hypothetical protein